ncbi:MAG: family 20 glycosylhydrolase [Kiritimatiellae bacterium]|nr:family 20 glycosylhydrolase [Kiritimatiellia bacterium]
MRPDIKYSAQFHLLPEPKSVRRLGGALALGAAPRILLETLDRPLLLAATALAEAMAETGAPASLDRGGRFSRAQKGDVVIRCVPGLGREAYRLAVGPQHVRLEGSDVPGLFYGLQTLSQLVRACGARLPRVVIEDRPAFPHRGYYLDITRGKVPRLGTLKRLANRLAALKINELQLYVEHVFDFRFDPAIAEGVGPITPGEILQLDAYCRDRCIELVPSLACFGHMGRILSLPAYRELAEVEWTAPDWRHATWRDRLRGATLNPRDPRSRKLLRQMTEEFLPLFTADRFNACCDETYDLGRGRSAAVARRRGVDGLYLDHIRFLRSLAQRHGKRLMFWGDVMLQHPRSIRQIPKDCIVLDWGYSPATPFEKAGRFIRCGLDTWVCPSVRGYQVVFNQVEEARANIAGYARAGARLGAKGLLTTDWGDMGHFNMLACALHGMALGAAMAWNPATDEHRYFDRAFSLHVFGDRSGAAAGLFKQLGTTPVASWPLFLADFTTAPRDLPSAIAAERAMARLREALADLLTLPPSGWVTRQDLHELVLGCRALLLNAEKAGLLHAVSRCRARPGLALRLRLQSYAAELRHFTGHYSRAWLAANKPSSLHELRRAMLHVARAARHVGQAPPPATKGRP